MHSKLLRLVVSALLTAIVEPVAWGQGSPFLAAGKAPSQQESPFAGTWVANLAKSKRHANHQFHSVTLKFGVVGNTVTLTHGGVNAGGQQESGTVVLQADGQEHSVPEQAGVVIVTKWAGQRVLQTVAKSGGATVGESSYEVSPDGKTLTATVSGTDASGSRFDHVIVFDRKEK